MKLKPITILSFSLALAMNASAQLNYQKTIDCSAGNDYGNMLQMYNGNLSIIGTTNAVAGNGNDLLLINTDLSGTVQSGFCVGGAGTEFGTAMYIANASGETTIVGRSNSYSPGNIQDVFAARLNAGGNPIFVKVFGTDSIDYATVVKEASDGGFIMAGRLKNNDKLDGLVVKMDSVGNIQWSKNIGTSYTNEVIYDVKSLGNMYLVAGYSGVNTIGLNESFFSILNAADGSMQGTFLFGGAGDDDARMAIDGPPGKFFLAGNTRSSGAGLGDIYLARFDVSNFPPSLDWVKTYGGTGEDAFTSSTLDSLGNIIITGITSSFGTGGDALAFKVDTAGSLIWANNYGGTSNDAFQSIVNNGTNGFTILGYSNSNTGSASNDLWLVNIDASGSSSCSQSPAALVVGTQAATYITPPNAPTLDFTSTDIVLTDRAAQPNGGPIATTESMLCTSVSVNNLELNDIQVYPNPSNEVVNINLGNNAANVKSISVFNYLGSKVSETSGSVFNSVYTLNVSNLVNGLYTIVINTKNQQLAYKISVTK